MKYCSIVTEGKNEVLILPPPSQLTSRDLSGRTVWRQPQRNAGHRHAPDKAERASLVDSVRKKRRHPCSSTFFYVGRIGAKVRGHTTRAPWELQAAEEGRKKQRERSWRQTKAARLQSR